MSQCLPASGVVAARMRSKQYCCGVKRRLCTLCVDSSSVPEAEPAPRRDLGAACIVFVHSSSKAAAAALRGRTRKTSVRSEEPSEWLVATGEREGHVIRLRRSRQCQPPGTHGPEETEDKHFSQPRGKGQQRADPDSRDGPKNGQGQKRRTR